MSDPRDHDQYLVFYHPSCVPEMKILGPGSLSDPDEQSYFETTVFAPAINDGLQYIH